MHVCGQHAVRHLLRSKFYKRIVCCLVNYFSSQRLAALQMAEALSCGLFGLYENLVLSNMFVLLVYCITHTHRPLRE
jgi:hypothetical protein